MLAKRGFAHIFIQVMVAARAECGSTKQSDHGVIGRLQDHRAREGLNNKPDVGDNSATGQDGD